MIAADLQSDLSSLNFNDTTATYILPKIVDGEDSFVTYDVFKNSYWPKFPRQMTKGLGRKHDSDRHSSFSVVLTPRKHHLWSSANSWVRAHCTIHGQLDKHSIRRPQRFRAGFSAQWVPGQKNIHQFIRSYLFRFCE